MTIFIILRGPQGERKVEEGVPYRMMPGEVVIGSDGSDRFPVDYDFRHCSSCGQDGVYETSG